MQKKLHKLRNCPILIKYLTQETIQYNEIEVTYLISEYVEGETLTNFLKKMPGKRLPPFQAIHLLYKMACGIEDIHRMKEYHGDIHQDNVIVKDYGLQFDLKILDMFHWGPASQEHIRHDVINLIKIFYESIGGKKYYSSAPPAVKEICCGLKSTQIVSKFRSAGQLKQHIENFSWN